MTRSIVAILVLALARGRHVLSQQQGTDLGGGVITRTDVQEYADLSLDVADIRVYAAGNQADAISGLYVKGKHAAKSANVLFPLADLSNDLVTGQPKSPIYLFHLYGLAGLSPSTLFNNAGYALVYIEKTITSNINQTADAVLSLSMWMYAAHKLYDGALRCQQRTEAGNPNLPQLNIGGGGMDEFIALWIGTSQTPGTQNGNGLYAWTQWIGDIFGTTSPEAAVNSNLKLLYQEGATTLSLSNACSSSNLNTVVSLWNVVVQMRNEMIIPLFQYLIYSLLTQDSAASALYSLALVPQLSACRPSVFNRLKENLLDQGVQFNKLDTIIQDLQDSLSCFDISCSDIGSFNDTRSGCSASTSDPPVLAGFATSSDVAALSRIDLDIYHLRILASIGSYDYASMLYMNGHNVPKPRNSENDPYLLLSLYELATTPSRSTADPTYTQFVNYHNDKNYANKAVLDVLNGVGDWGAGSHLQRAEAIGLTSSYQIVYLDAIGQLNDAVLSCQAADSSVGFVADRNPLDEAAAFLIGYMEGEAMGGSSNLADGELIWKLGNEYFFQFSTGNSMGYATVNSDIQDRLYAGKGELDALDCTKLERTVLKIQSLMAIPICQGVVAAAIASAPLPATSNDLSLVQGEILAQSILPIINSHDVNTAQVIQENMIIKYGVKNVRDGPQTVADAIGDFVVNGLQLPCYYLGSTSGVNPCKLYGGQSSVGRRHEWSALAWIAGILVLSCTLVL